jgi:WD40 repeat protein
VLISGSLDNTIKVWDIDTAKATQTLFGHIEGVWAVASDKLRLISGSHDRTIKVRPTLEQSYASELRHALVGVEPRGRPMYSYTGRTSWRCNMSGPWRGQDYLW